MGKKTEEPDDKIALQFLVKMMSAANATYAPGIEVARVEAAEAILKHARGTAEAEHVDAALEFLLRAVLGQVTSLGVSLRARAAVILLAYQRNGAKVPA